MDGGERWQELIRAQVAKHWPEVGEPLIRAQMAQESSFDPKAKSKCGACGLMQLMPDTFTRLMPRGDIWDPEQNVEAGIRYLKQQYDHLDEIPDHIERLRFALASYNCGRGYINVALKLAAQSEDIDVAASHPRKWPAGRWQTWETAKTFLAVEGCSVVGRHPDYRQVWHYVKASMKGAGLA